MKNFIFFKNSVNLSILLNLYSDLKSKHVLMTEKVVLKTRLNCT